MTQALAQFVALAMGSVSITAIIAALGALGALSGVATFLLAPRQGRSIAVSAAEGAVRAVNQAMEQLQRELKEAQDELAKAQRELRQLRGDYEGAIHRREQLEHAVADLEMKVRKLEHQLWHSRRAIDRGELDPPYQGPERRSDPPDE